MRNSLTEHGLPVLEHLQLCVLLHSTIQFLVKHLVCGRNKPNLTSSKLCSAVSVVVVVDDLRLLLIIIVVIRASASRGCGRGFSPLETPRPFLQQ